VSIMKKTKNKKLHVNIQLNHVLDWVYVDRADSK
jgi:hypothetical protein